MKKCPFCAEEIQDDAIKCRFCNEFLDGRAPGTQPAKKTEWYYRNSTLIVGFFLVGPLILPLIWFNPYYSKKQKIILFSIGIVITIILYKALSVSMSSIEQYYQILDGNY